MGLVNIPVRTIPIKAAFEPVSKSPFSNPPRTLGVVWPKPEMVVEVSALEVTHDGSLRITVRQVEERSGA